MRADRQKRGIIATLAILLATAGTFTRAGNAVGAVPPEHFTVKVALPAIPDRAFHLADFGGVGDGNTLNTDAFKKAIAAVEKAGGGHLIVSRGKYVTLPFTLCSNLDLHLDDGAVIEAPDNFAAYGLPRPETLSSQAEVKARVKAPPPLISGNHLHDVAITGHGAIDGNGALWWAWSERADRNQRAHGGGPRLIYPRAKLVVINDCDRLHIDGVTFRNSPKFHLGVNANDLLIENATFEAPEMAPNTDAIDPTRCNRMIIRNCTINVGDDDVAIKSGGHQLLIENCRIQHGHGISIGSGTADGISDMVVRHCTFDGTDNGIRIKSMRGAGGLVEHIHYSDIRMKNVANAIVLQLNYVDNNRPDFRGDPTKIPVIRDIVMENVTVENARNAGEIVGIPDSKITGITLKNVHITAEKPLAIQDVGTIDKQDFTCDLKPGIGPPRRKELE